MYCICVASKFKLKFNLVGAESRISKQSTEQDCPQRSELSIKVFEDDLCEELSEERCSGTHVER